MTAPGVCWTGPPEGRSAFQLAFVVVPVVAIAALLTLFGGANLPLWFFPDGQQPRERLQPHQSVAFVSAAIWLGEITADELPRTLALGAVWIAVRAAVCQPLWSLAGQAPRTARRMTRKS